MSGTSNKETTNTRWCNCPGGRLRSLFAGGQIILFNAGVQKPRTRDKQMLDGRTGGKEAGGVDGTGSLLLSCGRPAPPVPALVCSL